LITFSAAAPGRVAYGGNCAAFIEELKAKKNKEASGPTEPAESTWQGTRTSAGWFRQRPRGAAVAGAGRKETKLLSECFGLREIGILAQSLLPSYHLFSNLRENRMNTGDFYDLSFFNSFNPSA